MKILRLIALSFLLLSLHSCGNESALLEDQVQNIVEESIDEYAYGYNLSNFTVIRDTIKSGDSFGEILERNRLGYPKIYQIAEKAKDSFDIRKLQVGKPYMLLCTNDSLREPQSFIYEPNKMEYVVIEFCDSIITYKEKRPLTYVEKEASGLITANSSISQVLDQQGLSPVLAFLMANDIYAWTIDFNRLQPGDRFKVVYTDKYIEDSIYGGIDNIKAAYFEHNNEPFYAFEFQSDSVKGIVDYFDEKAKNLRRAFLRSPIKFGGRLSSRYNLRRRIAYYGNKVRPHRGTDFAASVGTPILATANGTVEQSSYTRGNGKYVKIRHNATYSTQYLHMKNRKAKVGQYVKQGDVIGWVGMTGNTGGPHVCYRFWKNGRQVDPFKQKLPAAESIPKKVEEKYLEFIVPIKEQLDAIQYVELDIIEEDGIEITDQQVTQSNN